MGDVKDRWVWGTMIGIAVILGASYLYVAGLS